MEKKCFIIMPNSDPDGYAKGHIGRVYQYILVPACRFAGFSPLRMDDPTIQETPLDIINTIIESDIVLCDLSSNDPHALYGFAIRQSMGLPVILMKDLKTILTANIPEIEILEYDESLRIDTVQSEIETLSEALKKVFANKPAPNSLLSRLNIGSAQLPEIVSEVTTAPLPTEDEAEKHESHLPVISPLPEFVGDPLTQQDIDKLKVGDSIFHINYGKGEILTINKQTKDSLVKIRFVAGTKLLVVVPSGIFRKIIAKK
jgi:hypothetical protein